MVLTRILAVLVVSACAVEAQSQAADAKLKELESQLQRIRMDFAGEMAIYAKNLKTGEEIALDADRVYETFSVIKVPIMAEVFRRAGAGEFRLSDRIKVKSSDARLPSGVLHFFEPGLNPTILDLTTLMIVISDNTATDVLADKVGRGNVTKFMQQLGLRNTTIEFSDLEWDRVWTGHLDPRYRTETAENVLKFPFEKYADEQVSEAFRKAIYDSGIYFGHSTAREMGRVFELMAQGKLVSKAASDQMIEILKKQRVNNRFPRYLRKVEMAHKTGDGQPHIANDAGILWVKGQPIVLVVFTGRHRGTTAAVHDAVARVAAYVARQYGAELTGEFRER